MRCRVSRKCFLSSDGPVDIHLWNLIFLCLGVAENRDILSMKEVENSIVHTTFAYPKFINAVSQDVGEGSPQLVAILGQQFNGRQATFVCLLIGATKRTEPIQHRNIFL